MVFLLQKRQSLLNQRGPSQQSIIDELIQASSLAADKLKHLSDISVKTVETLASNTEDGNLKQNTATLVQGSPENKLSDGAGLKRKQPCNNNSAAGDTTEETDVKKAKVD